MNNKRNLILSAAAAGCLAAFAFGCSPNRAAVLEQTEKARPGNEELRVLTIGTADSGGTMYPVGSAIAQAISNQDRRIKINVSASNGSLTNINGIVGGQFDLGLVSGDVAFSAYHGTDGYPDAPAKSLRAVAAVYTSVSNWMAADSKPIAYVHDLAGKKVAVGPQGSTTELSARTALSAAGLDSSNATLGNYGLGSGAEAVKTGALDAVHGFAGAPVAGLESLAAAVPSHLLKYTDEELAQIVTENAYYFQTVIPAGTYPGQEEDIGTFGVKCLLCVSSGMDEELAYTLAKALDESAGSLAERHPSMAQMQERDFLCGGLPIPLHPGAEKYYREAGILNTSLNQKPAAPVPPPGS